jgi:uncharacterized integral membrane protein
MLTNRRMHLVVALALVGLAITRCVADLVEIESLSPLAVRGCLLSSLALAALVVWRVSRSPEAVMPRAVTYCAAAGGAVGLLTISLLEVDRPDAKLSFAGGDAAGPLGAIVLGMFAGAIVGVVVGGFALFARSLNRRAPELTCVAAWGLAAVGSLAARNYLALVPCIIGAAIQLASMRRPRPAAIIVRPYR